MGITKWTINWKRDVRFGIHDFYGYCWARVNDLDDDDVYMKQEIANETHGKYEISK